MDFLQTYCACIENVQYGFLMELELILTKLWPFKLRQFWQHFCTVEYEVFVINSSYSFQWIFLKLCRHIVDLLKMNIWSFDRAAVIFTK